MKVNADWILKILLRGVGVCRVVGHHLGNGHAGEGHPASHHAGAQRDCEGTEELRQAVVLCFAGGTHRHSCGNQEL